MFNKKSIRILGIFLLIISVLLIATSCSKGIKTKDNNFDNTDIIINDKAKEERDKNARLNQELYTKLFNSIQFNENEMMQINLNTKIKNETDVIDKFNINLIVKANLNLNNKMDNLVLMKIIDLDDERSLFNFSVLIKNKTYYVNVKDRIVKLDSVELQKIIDDIMSNITIPDQAKELFSALQSFNIAPLVFNFIADDKIEKVDNTYTKHLDLVKLWETIKPYLGEIEVIQPYIEGRIDMIEGIINVLDLTTDFTFNEDDILSGLNLKGTFRNQKIEFNANQFSVKNGENITTEIYNSIPDLNNATVSKLANFVLEGKINLNNKAGSNVKKIMNYNYKVVCDLDPIVLYNQILEGGIPAKTDHFLYFTLSQEVNDQNRAFLNTKFDKVDGTLLEVVFDPKTMGTNDFYVAFALKSFLSQRAVEQNISSLVKGYVEEFPEYFNIRISPNGFINCDTADDIVKKPIINPDEETSETDKFALLKEYLPTIQKYYYALKNKETIRYSLEDIGNIIGKENLDLALEIMSSSGYEINDFEIEFDTPTLFSNNRFNTKQHLKFVKNDKTGTTKNFNSTLSILYFIKYQFYFLDRIVPKMSGNALAVEDYNLMNISIGELKNMLSDGWITYSTLNENGSEIANGLYARIKGIHGIDYNNFTTEQTVTIIVDPLLTDFGTLLRRIALVSSSVDNFLKSADFRGQAFTTKIKLRKT